jgi:hypothetical protein
MAVKRVWWWLSRAVVIEGTMREVQERLVEICRRDSQAERVLGKGLVRMEMRRE